MKTVSSSNESRIFREMGKGIGLLAKNETGFQRVAKAVEANDAKVFRSELKQLRLVPYCLPICRWFCVLRCGWRCRYMCVEPPVSIGPHLPPIPDLLQLAKATARVAQDRAMVQRLHKAIESRDRKTFRALAGRLGKPLGREVNSLFCYWICQWKCSLECTVRCRLFCLPK